MNLGMYGLSQRVILIPQFAENLVTKEKKKY